MTPVVKIIIAVGAAYLDFSVVNVQYLKSLKVSKALNETDAVHMHFTQKEDSVNDVGKLCLYHRWLAKIRNWHKRVHEG